MRTKQGVITSAKMQGTVAVTVHRAVFHPLYKKRYRMSKKFLADTNGMDLGVGDLVEITECRPLSKRKCFRVTEMIKQAPKVSEMAEEASLQEAMTAEVQASPSSQSPLFSEVRPKRTKEDESSSP
ncbi:30S ribosomal protein S17 [Candidatus Peregrinibacteria bacterium]|nr:30S ribosomal protein S17 [Candidatus Peregrinibacteria bacterium]MBI3815932.1 30S ribosomal protein S17 [Candidatus Peregrinibacteria bacterium]